VAAVSPPSGKSNWSPRDPKGILMKLESLENLFLHEIKDLLSAEKQLVRALPKMAKGAASQSLQSAIEEHLEQTRHHVERLESIFSMIDKAPRAERCKAMEGMIEEGSQLLEDDGDEAVKDAALIAAAQKVEHYEISGYGTARTLAEMLGLNQAAELLQQTLAEEKETDAKLTELATSQVNPQAQAAGHA
jgi:ferritin-like metal-binding protein YciE